MMNKITLIFGAVCLLFCSHLQVQAQPSAKEALTNKVERIVKRMESVNVIMMGRVAQQIDRDYQDRKSRPIDLSSGNLSQPNSRVTVQRSQYQKRGYKSSFQDYQYLAGQRDFQIRQYRDLTDVATDGELLTLTDHENGVVRCYAFWALLERHYKGAFDLLKNHLKDKERIKTFGDFDIDFTKVGDFYIDLMEPEKISTFLIKMTKAEQRELEKILIEDNSIPLDHRRNLIVNLESTEENYSIKKELVETNKSPQAVVALAPYQKEEDLSYLKDLFVHTDKYYALAAARAFPHADLFPLIAKVHQEEIAIRKPKQLKRNRLMILYQALVQYKDPASKELLEQTFNIKKKIIKNKNLEYLWLALQKYPDAQYKGMQERINLDSYDRRRMMKLISY